MTTFNEAVEAGDLDALGMQTSASEGNASAWAAAAATLTDRYPGIVLPTWVATIAGPEPTGDHQEGVNDASLPPGVDMHNPDPAGPQAPVEGPDEAVEPEGDAE